MAKSVLGNDPFQRGAAAREPAVDAVTPPPKKKKAPAKKKAPTRAAKALGDAAVPVDGVAAPLPPNGSPIPVPAEAIPAPAELPASAPATSVEATADEPAAAERASPEAQSPAEPVDASAPAESAASPDDEADITPEQAAEGEKPITAEYVSPRSARESAPLLERAAQAFAMAREVASHTLKTEGVSRLAQVAEGVFSAVVSAVGASPVRTGDPFGKDEELARKLAPIADFLYDRYWRVTVDGAQQLPAGPSILVANHSGAIPVDGYVLHQALSRERPDLPEARWLTEDQVFHAPFVGTLFNRLGAIRASPENAIRLLREGRPVITFPEGVHGIRKKYHERYQLKRLGRGGFVKLAIRERVPIVPVAIVGAEESMPLFARLPGSPFGLPYVPVTVPPLPARWFIRFGEPIVVDDLPAEAADDLLQVQRVVERTRESIESMLKTLLEQRRSVFGG